MEGSLNGVVPRFARDGARPSLGLKDLKGTSLMDRFARRRDSRPWSEARTSLALPRADDRPGLRARRRARPQVEVLDSRLLMASGQSAADRAAASADLAARVQAVLKPYFDQSAFPGISVSIVKHGHVVLDQGFGDSNVATGASVEANTEFDIGSVTKTFTALGVLLLYQESQGTSDPLNLNAPIGDYLHDNKSFKLPRAWSHVTTMELLNMSSGIRDVGGPQPWQAELASIAKAPLLYKPGTESSYSSANYDLLGELIQQRTGESYSTFIQQQILDPLGMSQTQELGASAKVANQAVGYDAPRHGKWPKAAIQNGKAMFAAAGMVSTAQDMATYMTALLSDRILNPATYALMWTATPTPEYGTKSATVDVRGLGWDTAIDTSSEPTEVAKSGSVPGFSSELILYPSTDSGIFVSFNASYQGSRSSGSVSALQVAEAIYATTQTGSHHKK
jgi:CubicO group peptidase (beta-lactamase class C family)